MLSLRAGQYRAQFATLAWAHMAVFFAVVQSSFFVASAYQGIIWSGPVLTFHHTLTGDATDTRGHWNYCYSRDIICATPALRSCLRDFDPIGRMQYRVQFRSLSSSDSTLLPRLHTCGALLDRFLLPTSLVIVNDCAAYVFGVLLGRTPLIRLSPKKTWEGYLGAAVVTSVAAFLVSGLHAGPVTLVDLLRLSPMRLGCILTRAPPHGGLNAGV